jgi:hypothetical protein
MVINRVMDDVVQPNRKRFWVICVLLVLVAGGLAGGGVYYWQQQQLSSTKSDNQAQISDLNSKVSDLTKQRDTANAKIKTLSQPAAPSTPAVDDKTAITNVVTADCEATVGFAVINLNVGVLQPPFADVELGCRNPSITGVAGGAGSLILKKVNSQWVIIARPTNCLDAATRQNYGIPSSIDCSR